MKKPMRYICTMFAALIAAFIFTGSSIESKAETLPIGEAQTLPLNKALTFEEGYHNYYRTVTIPSSGLLKVHNIQSKIRTLEIRDLNDNLVFYDYWGVDDFSKYFRAGQYSMKIETYDYAQSVFYFTTANESFPETETVNNDTIETASVIGRLDNTTYRGVITTTDDYDWYKFSVPSNSDLVIKLNSISDSAYPSYLIEDAYENYVADSHGNGTFWHSLNAGTYYIRIGRGNDYNHIYTLQLNTRLSSDLSNLKVSKVKATASKRGKLNIKWDKVKNKNVAGYEIKVASDKNFYYTIGTYDVKSSAKSKKITIPPYYRGRKVYIKVRAFNYPNSNQKNYSNYSKIISTRVKK